MSNLIFFGLNICFLLATMSQNTAALQVYINIFMAMRCDCYAFAKAGKPPLKLFK
ncbi:hypothetical protein [Nonlabens sp.]|uniref:hypothetical protein n=1 Tax=Nonlabens sp. TaxID=1888209 RepID=UPI003F4AD362